jgi:hypothetical protein
MIKKQVYHHLNFDFIVGNGWEYDMSGFEGLDLSSVRVPTFLFLFLFIYLFICLFIYFLFFIIIIYLFIFKGPFWKTANLIQKSTPQFRLY